MEIMTAKSTSCYIIGSVDRPGALTFAQDLECRHYAPDTALNDLYNIFPVKYGDATHFIIEIPKSDMQFIINDFIKSYDLILRNGMPFSNNGKFPLICNDTQAWTLESNKELNSEEINKLLAAEHRKLRNITGSETEQGGVGLRE